MASISARPLRATDRRIRRPARHPIRSGPTKPAAITRRQLAPYGVNYTGPNHYSGDLEYDRRFLRQAWDRYPETPWGQRAFLMLQTLSCTAPNFGCQGPNCFREVIRQGERFLREYPQTPFLKEQTYHLALAYETWWSLGQARTGRPHRRRRQGRQILGRSRQKTGPRALRGTDPHGNLRKSGSPLGTTGAAAAKTRSRHWRARLLLLFVLSDYGRRSRYTWNASSWWTSSNS